MLKAEVGELKACCKCVNISILNCTTCVILAGIHHFQFLKMFFLSGISYWERSLWMVRVFLLVMFQHSESNYLDCLGETWPLKPEWFRDSDGLGFGRDCCFLSQPLHTCTHPGVSDDSCSWSMYWQLLLKYVLSLYVCTWLFPALVIPQCCQLETIPNSNVSPLPHNGCKLQLYFIAAINLPSSFQWNIIIINLKTTNAWHMNVDCGFRHLSSTVVSHKQEACKWVLDFLH